MNEEFKSMGLSSLVRYLKGQGLSLAKQSKMWGVTPLQIHYYKTGKTKQANPGVCMHVFNNIKVENKPVLIDSYDTPDALRQAYKAYISK